jgi:hypothetical protein
MATAVISPVQELSGIERLLTLEETGRILGRSHWTLRMDYKAGRIKCVRIGRRLMVDSNEVRRIMQDGLSRN